MQRALFADATVPSPICCMWLPCPRKGRSVLGPAERIGDDCINRSIRCLTCGRTGIESTNLTVKA